MLSTTSEYALRIMIVLAESETEPTTSERIAGLTKVPTDYSVKVLQMLARAACERAGVDIPITSEVIEIGPAFAGRPALAGAGAGGCPSTAASPAGR